MVTSFQPPGPDAAVYVISVAAELSGLHPQTLRTYERMGLITPGRTPGGGRRYSFLDIERLRQIAELTASGIGIEGVGRSLVWENPVGARRSRNAEIVGELDAPRVALGLALGARTERTANLPVLRQPAPGQSVVVWRRQS